MLSVFFKSVIDRDAAPVVQDSGGSSPLQHAVTRGRVPLAPALLFISA